MARREVEFQPPAAGSRSGKLVYTLYEDGKRVAHQKVDPASPKHQAQVAREAGVDRATVLGWFDALAADPTGGKKFLLEDPAADGSRPRLTLYVRGLEQKREEAAVFRPEPGQALAPFFSGVFRAVGPERIVEWPKENAADLAMLDIDYHDPDQRPPAEWVETAVRGKLIPLGPLWNMTKNGGAHVYYFAQGRLTAEEVASVAALAWKAIDPTAGVEVKAVSRGLPAGRELLENPEAGVPEEAALAWMRAGGGGEAELNSSVDEWLEERGMVRGGRYPHEQCPIDSSASHGDPVTVGDDGIYCHRCRGLGRAIRGGRPGFVSWLALIGGVEAGVLRSLVRNLTHWGHAKWVLRAVLGLDGPLAKSAYSAALKLVHGGTEREALIPLVFHPDTEYLVRFDGYWGTVEEGHVYPSQIDDLLGIMPVTCFLGDDGKIKVSRSAVTLMRQTTMTNVFRDRGYPAVQVVRGLRMHKSYSDPQRLVVSSPAPWLASYPTALHPRYVERSKRMPVEQAQEILEKVLPGINWTYLKALILARACNEARYGLPQHLLVTGVSKAGKTSHVKLAAGILGDVASEPLYVSDIERFRSQVRDASQSGSFVSFDEFIKNTVQRSPRMTAVQAMDPLLNFTPNSLSHKLYVGPVRLGHVGVCIWTETWIPEVLRNNTQIARRVHYVSLAKQVEWERGLTDNGISEIEKVRVLSDEHANACNAIVSDLIDEFLGIPQTFEQLAAGVGVTTLEKSPDFYDPKPKLLEFFRLVCEAPDADVIDSKKFEGAGWKVIHRENEEDDLVSIWSHLADGSRSDWLTSRQVAEKDWGAILGVPVEVRCDLRHDGSSRVAVRFRVGPMQEPTLLNQQIKEMVK